MNGIWALLADPGNQTTLIWIGGGLLPAAAVLWVILRLMAGRGSARRGAKDLAGFEITLLILVVIGALTLGAGLLGRQLSGSKHQAEQPQVIAVGRA